MFNNEFISTGNKELDQKLNGGIAKSSLFSLIGEVGSDNTEFMLNVIKHNKELNKDFNVLYVDSEDSIKEKNLKELGINNIDILRPNPIKIQLDLIKSSLNSNIYDLIIIDSVNSLFSDTDAHRLSEWVTDDIIPVIDLKNNKTSIVVIEHITKLTNPFNLPIAPIQVGKGRSVGYYAHQRVWMKRDEKNELKYKIIKNRFGKDELDEVA